MGMRCLLSVINMSEIDVKKIVIKRIDSKHANDFIRKYHYSGKIVPNSQLHFGAFYDEKLHGVMSFGASMDKRKVGATVRGTGWNEFTELNRMAFDEFLPKNSESRALSVAIRLIRKHAPHIKWIVSFADATQSGDGTIYRASGFVLVNIKKNHQILEWNGKKIAKKTLDNKNYPKINGRYYSNVLLERGEAIPIKGFQIKYIYFIDKMCQEKLIVPVLPYSKIKEMGAKMYRGISC